MSSIISLTVAVNQILKTVFIWTPIFSNVRYV